MENKKKRKASFMDDIFPKYMFLFFAITQLINHSESDGTRWELLLAMIFFVMYCLFDYSILKAISRRSNSDETKK
jgi:hypothetical protein